MTAKIKTVAIQKRDEELLEKLLILWRDCVEKTHDFLSKQDIENLTLIVKLAVKEIEILRVIFGADKIPLAFMGVSHNKIEMLFVSIEHRGRGIGKRLVAYATDKLRVLYVDVNEQNVQALEFYKKRGFKIFGRDEQDAFGGAFPILHLRKEPFLDK
ncbi:MAG: GNAT family N-acetyltransferase [Helicobacteraceae bacterium]|jgi:putative acetyltransferase|nr:GNAT family N-acetyltransferase [Helicobacteraceae bacterium]